MVHFDSIMMAQDQVKELPPMEIDDVSIISL